MCVCVCECVCECVCVCSVSVCNECTFILMKHTVACTYLLKWRNVNLITIDLYMLAVITCTLHSLLTPHAWLTPTAGTALERLLHEAGKALSFFQNHILAYSFTERKVKPVLYMSNGLWLYNTGRLLHWDLSSTHTASMPVKYK